MQIPVSPRVAKPQDLFLTDFGALALLPRCVRTGEDLQVNPAAVAGFYCPGLVPAPGPSHVLLHSLG